MIYGATAEVEVLRRYAPARASRVFPDCGLPQSGRIEKVRGPERDWRQNGLHVRSAAAV